MTTIGIAIPCYRPHWEILPELLKNIQDSTRLPDKVVVSCSSWHENGERVLEEYPFPVLVLFTTETHNAAQNRNRAASRLDTDLISFMDADDRMNPRRLEIVLKTMDANLWIDALYHGFVYQRNYEYTFTEEDSTSCLLHIERTPDQWTNCRVVEPHMHHGHVTVRKATFQKLKFIEDAWAFHIEDGIYARQLIEQGFTIRYIPYRLSLYNPNPAFLT